MSFSSLAAVTEVSVEQTRRILTDIFQALVELSRRTAKEVKLHFAGSGYLYLYKNRELCFQQFEESNLPGHIRAARLAERDDLSVIDQASAVLSMGGGRAFSVKSSAHSKLSIMTPPTNLSVASSALKSRRYDEESIMSKKSRKKYNEAHSTVSRKSHLSQSGLMAVGDSFAKRQSAAKNSPVEPR
jgi:hypothetical protein